MKFFSTILFFLTISSCSFFTANETNTYNKSSNIQNSLTNNLPANWEMINKNSSDFAISNKISHSVFILNSACRKYEAGNLNSLTTAMLSGIDIIKTIENKTISYQGRDAIDLTVLGKVDGVERYFHILTTQKNNCIYDLVLISTSEKNLKEDNRDFQGFIQRIELN
jgi:hypothetical protein